MCSCLSSLRTALPEGITQFAPFPCYMLLQSPRLRACNKHSIRAGRGHCITQMQYFLAGFIDQALKPSTSTLWNILLPGRQAMYACICETGRGFFAGVCTPSNATVIFRDPPHPAAGKNRSPIARTPARRGSQVALPWTTLSLRVELNHHTPSARAPLACHPGTPQIVVDTPLKASQTGALLVGTPSCSSHDLMS